MKIVAWWQGRLWWVRWTTYAVIAIGTFYGVEDFRGHRALERAKAEYLASGLRLDLDEIRGPAIPDDENFAASEIIREAYADPYGPGSKLFPENTLPERPSDATRFEYHGFRGNRWNYPDLEAKAKYDQECLDAIITISPQLRRYFEAAMRPSCDWWAVTDPSDFEALSHHLSLIIQASRVLPIYPGDPKSGRGLPVSKSEVLIGNLAATKHLKTNSSLINQLIGMSIGQFALESLANDILNRNFTTKELNAVAEHLESIRPRRSRSFIEFETAVGISRYGGTADTRRIYLEQLDFGYGVDPIFEFPALPFDFELSGFEHILNRMIVSILPRGWIWQGHALQIQMMLGKPTSDLNPLYTLLSHNDDELIPRVVERVEAFHVSIQLAQLAVEIEKHRLLTGTLPGVEEFKTNSPKIGYTIEENGQPMLWYSEDIPLGPPPTGKALVDYAEKHLWRYPPPES